MSNSKLVEYTQISPNRNSPRNHTIDRITPHCYVGQVTAEGMAAWLCTESAQASANYCIDKDGRVALLVDEADRSWCSSNAQNDHRAITIECASDTYEPYAINQCVYDKLIELMADICKRNGKTKLLWFADREKTLTYTPKENEMVITVHRWFANKSCPGDYIYNRLGQIADAVNVLLGSKEESKSVDTVPDNAKIIWTFLKSKGLNDFAVAGIMGNLRAESALSPINMQDSFEPKLDYTDATYTKAVDNGSYTNFVHDKCGYGLAQWTYWSRKQALLTYAHNQEKSIGDLQMQLDFLWREMQGYEVLMAKLNRADDVRDASTAFLMEFEKPADMGQSQQDRRFKFSQEYYDTFAVKEEKKEEQQHYYKIQAGAFSKKENADKQIKKLSEHGISAILVYSNGMYKVQAGAYAIKKNAQKKLEEVHKAGFADAFITE